MNRDSMSLTKIKNAIFETLQRGNSYITSMSSFVVPFVLHTNDVTTPRTSGGTQLQWKTTKIESGQTK